MDANGLSPEQQALLASIMGKSSQAGGGGGFTAAVEDWGEEIVADIPI